MRPCKTFFKSFSAWKSKVWACTLKPLSFESFLKNLYISFYKHKFWPALLGNWFKNLKKDHNVRVTNFT